MPMPELRRPSGSNVPAGVNMIGVITASSAGS